MKHFKEKIITAAMEESDRIYIHAAPNKELIIGSRGLIGNEQTNGIILSISSDSATGLTFDESGVSVQLRFAGVPENVFIPYEAIDTILDDLKNPTFVFNLPIFKIQKESRKPVSIEKEKVPAKIVKPDFSKKHPEK